MWDIGYHSKAFLESRNINAGLLEVVAEEQMSYTAATVFVCAAVAIFCIIGGVLVTVFGREVETDSPKGEADAKPKTESSGPLSSISSYFDARRSPRLALEAGDPNSPALHFSSAEYVADRRGGSVTIRLIRAGKLDKRTVVAYRTTDVTGQAGQSYVAQSESLTFEPGQNMKQFDIQLIPPVNFESAKSFHVELLKEGLEGGQISRHLHKTVVRTVDFTNYFPGNEFEDQITSGDYPSINKRKLLTSYCFHTFNSQEEIRRGTIKVMIIDQLDNIKSGWTLLATVYLIDRVLNKEVDVDKIFFKDRSTCLVAVVFAMGIPYLIMFIGTAYKGTLCLPQIAKSTLQRTLMSQYQAYNPSSEVDHVKHGLFMVCLFNDTNSVVKNGYMKAITLFKLFGKATVLMLFLVVAPEVIPLIRGKHKRVGTDGLINIIALPIVLTVVYLLTHAKTQKLIGQNFGAYSKTVHCGMQCVENHRVIQEYKQAQRYRGRFHSFLLESMHQATKLSTTIGAQASAAQLITAILVALLTWTLGIRVLEGKVDVGMMVANLNVLRKIGSVYSEIFGNIVGMQKSLGSLMRITKYANLGTVHGNAMKFRKAIEEMTMEYTEEQLAKGTETVVEDQFPIVIPGCCITNATGKKNQIRTKLEIQQGQVIVFMGEGAEALIQMLDPENHLGEEMDILGVPFVPSHLRTLIVSREPMFVDGTLLSNLTLGNDESTLPEVLFICTNLGVSESTMSLLSSGEEKSSQQWKDVLSAEEQEVLTVARAFIARPHLLCFESPGTILDNQLTRKVMQMARNFVDSRAGGVRPHTVIMTAYQLDDLDLADKIYHISSDKGLRQVSLRDLRNMGYK